VTKAPKPPPEVVEAATEAVADELAAEYPELEVTPHRPGRRLPAGAIHLPGAGPADREALLDRPAPDRRGDDDRGD
jgi:hypothetical protein